MKFIYILGALVFSVSAYAQPVIQQIQPYLGANALPSATSPQPMVNQEMDLASCEAILVNVIAGLPATYVLNAAAPDSIDFTDPATTIRIVDSCEDNSNGRYHAHVAGNAVVGTPGAVACPAAVSTTKVIIGAGQSLMANRIDELFAAGAGVASYPYLYPSFPPSGGCVAFQDPYPLTDGQGGSLVGRIAAGMIATGRASSVVTGTVAVGGSSIANWLPGTAAYLKLEAYARAVGNGLHLNPTYILWEQGNSDVFAGTSTAAWETDFKAIVDGLNTDLGITATKWVVAKSTWGFGRPGATASYSAADLVGDIQSMLNIRAAQAEVVGYNGGQVIAGPDVDAGIAAWQTIDGVHRNGMGAAVESALWVKTLQ